LRDLIFLKLKGNFKERERFKKAREKLLKIRQQRLQPQRDDKAILSWNAYLIKNLAKAGWIFGRKDWVKQATEIEKVFGISWFKKNKTIFNYLIPITKIILVMKKL
jgi:uncharacterized protein YyaL (SSP411 family)